METEILPSNEPNQTNHSWTAERVLRLCIWSIPSVAAWIVFTGSGLFWWGCFIKGLEIGDHVYAILDALFMLALGSVAIRYSFKHETTWEGPALKIIGIALLVIVGLTTVFVAPYLKHCDDLNEVVHLQKQVKDLDQKEELIQTQNVIISSLQSQLSQKTAQLHEIESKRDNSAPAIKRRASKLADDILLFSEKWMTDIDIPQTAFTNRVEWDAKIRELSANQEQIRDRFTAQFAGRLGTLRDSLADLGIKSPNIGDSTVAPVNPMGAKDLGRRLKEIAEKIPD